MKPIIIGPNKVSWQDYKNLRLKALKEEPQAFATSFENEKDTTDEEWQNRLVRYIQGDGNWMFFARLDKDLIGMVGAYQTDQNRKQNVANVIAMFVTEEARGKGVSRLLIDRLLKELSEKSIKKAQLSVNKNQEAALNLYKNLGFEISGEEKVPLGDSQIHDEYLMEKILE